MVQAGTMEGSIMNRFVVFAGLIALGACASMGTQTATMPPAETPLAAGAPSAAQRGAAYAEAHCSGCHAIGRSGDSALAAAPHFRALGRRYPVSDLAEAFAEGIVTAHGDMPQFEMSTDENADLVAYLQSIQVPGQS